MGVRIALVAPNWSGPGDRPEQSAAIIYDSVIDTPLGQFFGALERGGPDGEYLLPEDCASRFLDWLTAGDIPDARTLNPRALQLRQDAWLALMRDAGWEAP